MHSKPGGRLLLALRFLVDKVNFAFGLHCTHNFSGSITCKASLIVVAEELFSINMNIVIVMFHFRSADLFFTCGQRIRT